MFPAYGLHQKKIFYPSHRPLKFSTRLNMPSLEEIKALMAEQERRASELRDLFLATQQAEEERARKEEEERVRREAEEKARREKEEEEKRLAEDT